MVRELRRGCRVYTRLLEMEEGTETKCRVGGVGEKEGAGAAAAAVLRAGDEGSFRRTYGIDGRHDAATIGQRVAAGGMNAIA